MWQHFPRYGVLLAAFSLLSPCITGLVAGEQPDQKPKRLDIGKGKIERPAKDYLARAATLPATATDNPSVEPGKIRWHADFGSACAAANQSKKPVLLFQMLGKLDHQFC
jgi:hypothetical protein